MEIEIRESGHEQKEVKNSIDNILEQNELCSLATVNPGEDAHIATAFYVYSDDLEFYILTPPETAHGRHLEQNDSIALAIFDSHQEWSDDKQGLQVSGTAEKLESQDRVAEALELYTERFPELEEFASSPGEMEKLDSRFYRIEPSRVKIFDEPRFGKETWVEVKVR